MNDKLMLKYMEIAELITQYEKESKKMLNGNLFLNLLDLIIC